MCVYVYKRNNTGHNTCMWINVHKNQWSTSGRSVQLEEKNLQSVKYPETSKTAAAVLPI